MAAKQALPGLNLNVMKSNMVNVHISEIRPGDTIMHTDGKERTVCRNNIRRDGFMGISLFGDTYRLGIMPVKKRVMRK